ncbi:DUF3253 domain-containing protein [Jannaschia sp. Os4]|uniref:DUF3253 domain-containing protein n=1 Tax=Jannaschia sp. Os4 TaxID=2807617 RepID=UPI00193A2EA0|nr:DUF3253 domain-containing protein [Jannaschia sp. Os4]
MRAEVERALRHLAETRTATFCPSEAARRVADDWRPLMPLVREVARDMDLRATQGGTEVDPVTARGPIRLTKR